MAVQKILLYPDEESALRKKSEPVPAVNRRVRKLIRDLKDTLRDHPEAIGLAAPQINVHFRLVLVHLGIRDASQESSSAIITLVNPEILEAGDEKRDFDGFDAVVVHHEIDHLDGVLFIDHIEKLEDLYRLTFDEKSKPIRVPVTTGLGQ